MGTQTVSPAAANVSLSAPQTGDDSKEGSSNKMEEKEQTSSENNDGHNSEDGEDEAGVVEAKQDDSETKGDSRATRRGRRKKQSKRKPLKRGSAKDKSASSILSTKHTKVSELKHDTPSNSVLPLDDIREAINDIAMRDNGEEESKEGQSSNDDDDNDSTAEADEDSQQDDTADTEVKTNGGKKRSARGQRKHRHSPKHSDRSSKHSSPEEDDAAAEHKEQDMTEEKQSVQQDGDEEKSEEKDSTDGGSEEEKDAMAKDDEEEKESPTKRTKKRKATVVAAKTSPTKRISRSKAKADRQDDHHQHSLLHNTVLENATLPLHPIVMEILQYQHEGAQLQRVYTKGDGSCMLNSPLMGMNNGIHPTTEQVQALRSRLKTTIEGMTQEAWDSLENNGQCSTPHEYTQRFLMQPDAFLDRSILQFVLQLIDLLAIVQP